MTYLFRLLHILDHVLICFVLRVDTRLRALYGERKRIHDHDGMPDDLSLHKPHDFPWYTRARVYDLMKESPVRPINMHVSELKTGQSKCTIFIKATADILHCLKWWGLCEVVGVPLEKYQ